MNVFAKRQRDPLFANLHEYFIPKVVPQPLQIISRNVGNQRSEWVIKPNNLPLDALLRQYRSFR